MPTVADAVKLEVICGTRHCGAELTTTVRVVVAVSPPESVTEYESVVVPRAEVFTVPVLTMCDVKSPSSASVAVAPGSVKV